MASKPQVSEMKDLALDALTDAIIARLVAKTQRPGYSTKAVSGTASPNYLHGPGSLLGVLGLPDIINNAMVLPLLGVAGHLERTGAVMISPFEDKIHTILTGQTASSGVEPTMNCDDSKQPGNLKLCNQIWPFGRQQLDSQVIDITQIGRLINRGEFLNPTLIGNPFGDLTPEPMIPPQEALRTEFGKKITELFIALNRDYGHLTYDGNPANTAGNAGGYLEQNGLDRLINTGYRDAESGIACAAADLLIIDFGGAVMNANAQLLVRQLSEMVRAQKYLAERSGQAPVEFALAMRYSAFLIATEVWPCAYFTTMCTATDLGGGILNGSFNVVDAGRQIELRNQMREGMYLLTIFGDKVPVILDDFINETVPVAGQFQSDIYLVPLTTIGGRPSLYLEHFNWDGPNSATEIAALMAPAGTVTTTGGGRWLLVRKMPNNTCMQIQIITKRRLILETPFLAARLTNVGYQVLDHERDFTGGTPDYSYGYQPDGGQTRFYPNYTYPPFPN